MNIKKNKINYIECPDKNCKVWLENGNIEKLCKDKCKKTPKLYIICPSCGKKIYCELNKNRYLRIDCECGACIFTRMSEKYERIIK
jgi:hypothetical protein